MTPAALPAITVRGLTKRYEDFSIGAQDISFDIATGTCAALVGPPGSGKSTVAGILLGLLPPTAGSVTLAGGRSSSAVGAVLAPRGLHPRRTVRDHLRVYAAAAGCPDSRVRAVLETTGLTDRAGTVPDDLTPGEQTRAALATALLPDPRLLVLDDPVAGMQLGELSWLQGFLRNHTRRGGTVLFTAPSLVTALPIADYLVVLSNGSVAYQGSPARLRRRNPDRLVVASSSSIAIATALAARGFTDAVIRPDEQLAVADATEDDIVAAARAADVRLHRIVPDRIHPDRVLASLTRAAAPRPVGPGMPPPASLPYGVAR
ncbi:ATP-binding cassette domain-containing protein [Nocardia jinanensis]|uniref:ABC transporter ATP-binding protein n=1 Tax=Nocardia jinanensis TaxID=382504 RepID=A0A917RHF6_9NOCA|nr:ABC transporter ATP-binding protein [Nocardia jinanensis]GGL08021.1 ABC transporter ATP-binding protein [Nocardia jinanensis]